MLRNPRCLLTFVSAKVPDAGKRVAHSDVVGEGVS